MGAWGIDVFEDDSALDIVDGFDEIQNPKEFMELSFEKALQTDYLEYDDCINVLVSATLIDSIVNQTSYEILDEDYTHIIERIKDIDFTPLLPRAVLALEVVLSKKSELYGLWSQSTDYNSWRANVCKIINRLS